MTPKSGPKAEDYFADHKELINNPLSMSISSPDIIKGLDSIVGVLISEKTLLGSKATGFSDPKWIRDLNGEFLRHLCVAEKGLVSMAQYFIGRHTQLNPYAIRINVMGPCIANKHCNQQDSCEKYGHRSQKLSPEQLSLIDDDIKNTILTTKLACKEEKGLIMPKFPSFIWNETNQSRKKSGKKLFSPTRVSARIKLDYHLAQKVGYSMFGIQKPQEDDKVVKIDPVILYLKENGLNYKNKVADFLGMRFIFPTKTECKSFLNDAIMAYYDSPESQYKVVEVSNFMLHPGKNQYESINIVMVNSDNMLFELQIRTEEQDRKLKMSPFAKDAAYHRGKREIIDILLKQYGLKEQDSYLTGKVLRPIFDIKPGIPFMSFN